MIRGPIVGALRLDEADATMLGEEDDTLGWGGGVDFAGDIDADGRTDIVLGAPAEESFYEFNAGTTYVVFGPVTGTFSLSSANLSIGGEGDDDHSGFGAAGAGDVDGDGFADIVTSGFGDDDGGEDAGAVWLVLGTTINAVPAR